MDAVFLLSCAGF